MKKQKIRRKHNFQDGELVVLAGRCLAAASGEAAEELSRNGWGADETERLRTALRVFALAEQDDKLVGEQMAATERKDKAAASVAAHIRGIMNKVEILWPKDTGRWRSFGTRRLADMSDEKLYMCALNVVRVGTLNLSLLEETSLKQAALDNLAHVSAQFLKAKMAQMDKVSGRDLAVERRVALGNDVYDLLINLCECGKAAYNGKDPVLYALFTVYEENVDAS